MSRAFNDIYREVCNVEYGIRPEGLETYLIGEYWTGQPEAETQKLEIIWTNQNAFQVGRLVRAHILPRTVEIYAKEEDLDLQFTDKHLELTVGNVALLSRDLTAQAMTGIIQPPLSLRPLVS